MFVLQDWGTDFLLLLLFVRSPKKRRLCTWSTERMANKRGEGWRFWRVVVGLVSLKLSHRPVHCCFLSHCFLISVCYMTTLPWRRQLRSAGSPRDDSRISGYEKLLQLYTSVEKFSFSFFFPVEGVRFLHQSALNKQPSSSVITCRVNWLWPPLFRRGLILLPALVLMWSRSNRMGGCWLDVRFHLFVCLFFFLNYLCVETVQTKVEMVDGWLCSHISSTAYILMFKVPPCTLCT